MLINCVASIILIKNCDIPQRRNGCQTSFSLKNCTLRPCFVAWRRIYLRIVEGTCNREMVYLLFFVTFYFSALHTICTFQNYFMWQRLFYAKKISPYLSSQLLQYIIWTLFYCQTEYQSVCSFVRPHLSQKKHALEFLKFYFWNTWCFLPKNEMYFLRPPFKAVSIALLSTFIRTLWPIFV